MTTTKSNHYHTANPPPHYYPHITSLPTHNLHNTHTHTTQQHSRFSFCNDRICRKKSSPPTPQPPQPCLFPATLMHVDLLYLLSLPLGLSGRRCCVANTRAARVLIVRKLEKVVQATVRSFVSSSSSTQLSLSSPSHAAELCTPVLCSAIHDHGCCCCCCSQGAALPAEGRHPEPDDGACNVCEV